MKSVLQSIVVLCFTSVLSHAQNISCNSFCVTNIQLDPESHDLMRIDIFFDGEKTDFINYPYVSLITSPEGDTIGTGTLNFFGQSGNTTQTYVVHTVLDSIPHHALVYFNYDTVVCVLTYPCSTTAVHNYPEADDIILFPNPMTTEMHIQTGDGFENFSVSVFNAQGQIVLRQEHSHVESIRLVSNGLQQGLYYLMIEEGERRTVKRFVVVD